MCRISLLVEEQEQEAGVNQEGAEGWTEPWGAHAMLSARTSSPRLLIAAKRTVIGPR